MKFKVSVYPLNFYLVKKQAKQNTLVFAAEKMKVLLTQSEKLFEGVKTSEGLIPKLLIELFSRNNYIKIYA